MNVIPYLRYWAELLDSRFRVPGTAVRFGLDPMLSLIPGVGDLVSPTFTVAVLVQAVRQRVPRVVMMRMVVIGLADAVIGVVPVAGTVADVFWRANLRNLQLLERHAEPGRPPTPADYMFVLALALAFGLVAAVPVFMSVWLTVLLFVSLS